ncbi:MAG: hypothetical protein WD059_04315 [Balneolaceae bacterium]
MALIKKSDLALDYNWSSKPGTSPIKKESVGGRVFDPRSGDDVLDLINDYAEKNEIRDKEEVLRAEPMIRKKLPKDIENRENAMHWLWSAMGNDEEALK